MCRQAIIVFNGIICKWDTIKDIVNIREFRLANADEYRLYYLRCSQ